MATILAILTSNPTLFASFGVLIAKWLGDKIIKALPVKANTIVEGLGTALISVGHTMAGAASPLAQLTAPIVTSVATDIVNADAAKKNSPFPGQ